MSDSIDRLLPLLATWGSTGLGWYDVPGRPLTFVIDRDGTVRRFLTGGHPYEDFEAAVVPIL
jgi:peroxiredoxin